MATSFRSLSSLTLPSVGELRLPDKLERTTKTTDDRESWSTNNFWSFFICFFGRQRKQKSPQKESYSYWITFGVRMWSFRKSSTGGMEPRAYDPRECDSLLLTSRNLNISYRRQPQQMETANPTFLICLLQSTHPPRPCGETWIISYTNPPLYNNFYSL